MNNRLNDLPGGEWTFFLNSVVNTRYVTGGEEGYAHHIRKIHPSPKPPQLMRQIIEFFTKENEMVFDYLSKNEFDSIHSIFDAPLIHNAHKLADWRVMAKQLGCALENHPGDITLDSIQATMQAAEEGLGFALMDKKCIPTRIASHSLVAPFDEVLDSTYKLYLAYKEQDANQPEMMAVRGWLKSLFLDLA